MEVGKLHMFNSGCVDQKDTLEQTIQGFLFLDTKASLH